MLINDKVARPSLDPPQARNLAAADRNGLSDPFVKLTLLDKEEQPLRKSTRQTNVVPETLQPHWNEEIVLGSGINISLAKYLLVEVLDRDWFSSDGLGSVRLPLEKADRDQHGHEEWQWHALEQGTISSPTVSGDVELKVCYENMDHKDRGLTPAEREQ